VALAWSRAHLLAAPTWTDALLYLPAGALAALWLAERGMRTRRAAVAGALACALLWGMGECARGLAGGEMRPLAVLWRATWSALGATLAGAVAARPGWRARLLDTPPRAHGGAGVPLAALLYAGVILLWSLRPFLPETSVAAMLAKLTPEAFIPLSAQRDSYNLYSVADVAIGFLLYLPLGAWLCARPLRARGWLRGPLPGVWLAVAAELGQLFVARRVIDVTDVLVQAAGVACGWAVVRQADRARALAAQSALGNVSGGSASPSHAGARSSGATARVSSKW
jgi:VanZ family protein